MEKIKKRFFNSLQRGTGEAYLLQKENPSIDFSNQIIKGAICNFAYDPPCEGSRANYIYRLIKNSKQQEKITNKILIHLEKEKEDWHGLDQMCDLAVLFHRNGNTLARQALNNRFHKSEIEGFEICGQKQIIKLEGLDGVLKVAMLNGKLIFEGREHGGSSWLIDRFQKKNKTIDIYEILKIKGKQNKYIRAYYKSILAYKSRFPRRVKSKKLTYQIINDKINAGRLWYIPEERTKELSKKEVKQLANDFLETKDNKKKERYLRFFASRKFPFDYQPIFDIASGKNPKRTRLVYYAVQALKYFESKEIRLLGIQKINEFKDPSDYLGLLINNYKKGDDGLINEVVNRSNNYHFIHSINFGVLDIYEANPTKKCKKPLESIYAKMNCGMHRVDVLELLNKNRVLSEKILNEMKYDSYRGVRKLYKKIK